MNRQLLRRLVFIVSVVTFWPMALASPTVAIAQEAIMPHIVSADAVEIRDCPEANCPVEGTAPLGADVTITGEAVDGYVPIQYGDFAGYVPALFVAEDPGHPPYLVEGSQGCQRVAFLFNIGVGAEPDTGILDTLEANDVPAAMFLMGWWVEDNPPILQRMIDGGYLIGSHGYESIELTARSDEEVRDDVARATAAIEEAIGRPMDPYFTPYAAAIDDRVRSIVAAQGLLPVAWNVPSADYAADATADAVYSRVMDNMYDGGIVEFHLDAPASAESTGQALPWIIDDLRERGYQFVTIPEMTQPCQ